MKKILASLLAAVTIALTLTATATDVSAQWRRRGWGWGPGVAAGVIGGAVIARAIIASRPPGYVVYPGYAQPVYGPGCYWASQAVYDVAGRVVGYVNRYRSALAMFRLRRPAMSELPRRLKPIARGSAGGIPAQMIGEVPARSGDAAQDRGFVVIER